MFDTFFIFDPRLGGEQTAERKILFFHPTNTPLPAQVRAVGLCEALINFMCTFGARSTDALHTQKRRHVFFEAEPHIWLCLIVDLRGISKAPAKNTNDEEALEDALAHGILHRIYQSVRLHCGSLQSVMAARGVPGLRQILADVVPLLVQVAAVVGDADPCKHDLLEALNGICFLPLDRRLFLRIQYLVNLLLTAAPAAPAIAHVIIMHQQQLVWSSLTRAATHALHRYLDLLLYSSPIVRSPPAASSIPPAAGADAPSEESLAPALVLRHLRQRSSSGEKGVAAAGSAGSYVCGAGDLSQADASSILVPRIFVERQPKGPTHGCGGGGGAAVEVSLAGMTLGVLESPESGSWPDSDVRASGSVPGAEDETAGGEAAGVEPLSAGFGDGESVVEGSSAADSAAAGCAAAGGDAQLESYRLVVFKLYDSCVAMLVEEQSRLWAQPGWYQQLAALLSSEFQPIAAQLLDLQKRLQAFEDPYRYINFNRHNLALKCSIRSAGGRSPQLLLTRLTKSLLLRAHADLKSSHVQEIVAQSNDGWLVARSCAGREFYMLFDSRITSMSEVHQEELALSAMHFSHLFSDG